MQMAIYVPAFCGRINLNRQHKRLTNATQRITRERAIQYQATRKKHIVSNILCFAHKHIRAKYLLVGVENRRLERERARLRQTESHQIPVAVVVMFHILEIFVLLTNCKTICDDDRWSIRIYIRANWLRFEQSNRFVVRQEPEFANKNKTKIKTKTKKDSFS
jgi:hypothetical protein